MTAILPAWRGCTRIPPGDARCAGREPGRAGRLRHRHHHAAGQRRDQCRDRGRAGPSRADDTAAPGALLLDMGSSDPAQTLRLAPLRAAGLALVDAPVSGAVAGRRRHAGHHGGRRRRRPGTRASAAVAHGRHADPHRRGRLGPCHEGAEQLCVRRRSAGGQRGAADRAPHGSGPGRLHRRAQCVQRPQRRHRDQAAPVHRAGQLRRRLRAGADGQDLRTADALQAHAGVRVGSCRCAPGCGSARWRRWSRAWTTRGSTNTWSG